MASLLRPVLGFSNDIGGLLGNDNDNFGAIGNLLNIQMDMLENMSSKLDKIKESLDLIIENQEAIEKKLNATPSKTVLELYQKDIEGLFILLKEKVSAYIVENESGTITAERISLIFDEILRELQLARAKVMGSGYINIPLVATCLHFEVLLMVFANQPKSYIRVVLNSYKNWFEKVSNKKGELYVSYDQAKGNALLIKSVIYNLYTYNKTKFSESRKHTISVYGSQLGKKGAAEGELFDIEITSVFYDMCFKKFKYKIGNSWNDEEMKMIIGLIDRQLIERDEVYPELEVDYSSITEIPVYTFNKEVTKNGTVAPTQISLDFFINESWEELMNTPDKDKITDAENKPRLFENAKTEIDKLNSNGELLLMYAAFVKSAYDSLNAIEKISENLDTFDDTKAISFFTEYDTIQELNNNRIEIWQAFINEKIEKMADDEKKKKLLEINTRMQQLKNSEKDIIAAYDKAQKEFEDNLSKDLWDEIAKILEPIGKEIEKGIQNVGKEAEIFGQNLGKNLEKGIQDIGKQLERDAQNLGEGISASVTFVEDQVKAYGKMLSNAGKRLLEGKIVDAVWHSYTDMLKYSDENFAKAVQNSSLLNSIASSVCTIYGGPAGAAAYAAWYTYKLTKDLSLALKTGLIAGLTSYYTKEINGTEGLAVPKDEVLKKALATSAIGAIAIGASGGDEKAILEGFLKGAALSIASNKYKELTLEEIEGRAPTEGPVLKLGRIDDKYLIMRNNEGNSLFTTVFDENSGEYLVIPNAKLELLTLRELGRNVSIVGVGSVSDAGLQLFSKYETGVLMQGLAKLPYMNDMALFHDQWCDTLGNLNDFETMITILPATILTVGGSPTPLLTQIQELAIQNKEKIENP